MKAYWTLALVMSYLWTALVAGAAAQLTYYRGTTGTYATGGGVSYYCESSGQCWRYDLKQYTGGLYLVHAGSIPTDSWSAAGVDDNTCVQYVYFEYGNGGWPYFYDPDKSMLSVLNYIPNVGYAHFKFCGPTAGTTWMMLKVIWYKQTGNIYFSYAGSGSGSPPYDWDCDPYTGAVTPLFF